MLDDDIDTIYILLDTPGSSSPWMADALRLPTLTNIASCNQQAQRVSTLPPWRTNRSTYKLITFIFLRQFTTVGASYLGNLLYTPGPVWLTWLFLELTSQKALWTAVAAAGNIEGILKLGKTRLQYMTLVKDNICTNVLSHCIMTISLGLGNEKIWLPHKK